jgi:hypothetical protein
MLSSATLPKTILFLAFSFFIAAVPATAQQITGVWKGKIDRKKAEVKIIQKGDSIMGTSYYYESPTNYRRYTIKGYFDPMDNSVVWWDDKLIEEKGKMLVSNPGKTPLLSVADFNCPGGGQMFLDGKAAEKEDPEEIKGPVDLTKTGTTAFPDEWDFVIDNYTVGTNDPYIIDSVALVAFTEKPRKVFVEKEPTPPVAVRKKPGMVSIPPMQAPPAIEDKPVVSAPLTIEEKFVVRKKVLMSELPVEGDSIELRFYDNAQVDGDSITLFLNNELIFQHIRLTAKSYTIKLATKNLTDSSELIMVAENLGSIPPNTAFMIAIVGDKRYEVNLTSTEATSGLIRFRKNAISAPMKKERTTMLNN